MLLQNTRELTIYKKDERTGLWCKKTIIYNSDCTEYVIKKRKTTLFEKKFGYTRRQCKKWGIQL